MNPFRNRRQSVVAPAIALAGSALVAGAQAGWQANSEVVRRTAQQQPAFNYDEARVGSYTLPDPPAGLTGLVRTAAEWPARRAEILESFREHVYGRSPGSPERLRFDVIEENPQALSGAATMRRVAVISTQNDRDHRFVLTLLLPNKRADPAPVYLLLNTRPVSNTDHTREQKSGFWPVEEVVARGYGIAALQVADLVGRRGYHVRRGSHNLLPYDWARLGDFARSVWQR